MMRAWMFWYGEPLLVNSVWMVLPGIFSFTGVMGHVLASGNTPLKFRGGAPPAVLLVVLAVAESAAFAVLAAPSAVVLPPPAAASLDSSSLLSATVVSALVSLVSDCCACEMNRGVLHAGLSTRIGQSHPLQRQDQRVLCTCIPCTKSDPTVRWGTLRACRGLTLMSASCCSWAFSFCTSTFCSLVSDCCACIKTEQYQSGHQYDALAPVCPVLCPTALHAILP